MSKIKRSPKILFTCCRCKEDIYRAGKKVDIDNKLCGKCRGTSRMFSKRKQANSIPMLDEQNGIINKKQMIKNKLDIIQKRLDKARTLWNNLAQDTNTDFLTLWSETN